MAPPYRRLVAGGIATNIGSELYCSLEQVVLGLQKAPTIVTSDSEVA
jgi:hypothetical protein